MGTISKAGWLNKKSVKVKNKIIYSVEWNKIVDSFIDYLLERFNYYKSMQKHYDRLNHEETPKENVKFIHSIYNQVKQSRRKEREELISFFQSDVFVIAHENGFNGRMVDLFEQTIMGIGKYGNYLKKQKIDDLISRIIFMSHLLYVMDKTRLYSLLSSAFDTFHRKRITPK